MQNNFLSPFLLILVLVLILMSIVAIFYLYITAKNRERMALIERGMNPNLARGDFWIQVGIIGGGVAAGLMFSEIIPHSTYGPLFAILFAGVGLVIYNIWKKRKMQREGL
jgi:low temperature requirement protein LtrA